MPIFHDDVIYILRDEIPKYTLPYIDDVCGKDNEFRGESSLRVLWLKVKRISIFFCAVSHFCLL